MALDVNKVAKAALELLAEVGIDGLTTRRLAQTLGVKGPALYWHFKSKQKLIDHMVAVMFEPRFPGPVGQDWADAMADGARHARKVMLSYRDGARVVAASMPVDDAHRDSSLQPLTDAGYTKEQALYILLSFSRFVVGWTLAEQSLERRDERPPDGFDPEAAFEFGLEALITGVRLRLVAPQA